MGGGALRGTGDYKGLAPVVVNPWSRKKLGENPPKEGGPPWVVLTRKGGGAQFKKAL